MERQQTSLRITPLLGIALIGLLISAAVHLLTLVGVRFPGWVTLALFMGVFVVYLPVLISLHNDAEYRKLRRNPFRSFGLNLFKGAPT